MFLETLGEYEATYPGADDEDVWLEKGSCAICECTRHALSGTSIFKCQPWPDIQTMRDFAYVEKPLPLESTSK